MMSRREVVYLVVVVMQGRDGRWADNRGCRRGVRTDDLEITGDVPGGGGRWRSVVWLTNPGVGEWMRGRGDFL